MFFITYILLSSKIVINPEAANCDIDMSGGFTLGNKWHFLASIGSCFDLRRVMCNKSTVFPLGKIAVISSFVIEKQRRDDVKVGMLSGAYST